MSAGLGLPAAGTIVVRASGWTAGERPGELVRPLVEDPAGFRTMLMQILPGPLGEAHAHDTIEQIYVMEGDFFDEDASYRAGAGGPRRYRPPRPREVHLDRGSAGATSAAVMAAMFTAWVPKGAANILPSPVTNRHAATGGS